jgi:hypothetical protein
VPTDECETPVTRRWALSGLATLAGSAVAALATGRAAAQTATTEQESASTEAESRTQTEGAEEDTTTTEPAPSTTAPPKQPTEEDIDLLGFAQSLEFAAAVLYGQALPSLSEEISLEATVFRRHHQAYGEQIGALLGRQARGIANRTLVDERTSAFSSGAEPAVIRAAYDLESSLAATNTVLLERLRGTDGLALIASIQPIEARQSVVLGQAVGLSTEELLPVLEGEEPGAEVFTETQFPIS